MATKNKGTNKTVTLKNGTVLTGSAAQNYGRSSTNPVSSSTSIRAQNNATGVDIKGLKSAYDQSNAILRAEQERIAEERTLALGDIKTSYEIDEVAQNLRQEKDYGSRSTSLITSGGGFLGATQSQEGVLQNLKGTFETEHIALISKRDAAINAANAAYNDKDFALARELANNAKDLQNDIYKRQTDFADQQLKIASEKRQQTEFDMGIADKKISAYSMMSDIDFSKQNPDDIAELDASYYPGYTNAARTIAKKALDVKTNKEAVALDADILDMRLKMPYGAKFTLNGVTYTGLKQKEASGGGTEAERKSAAFNKISEILSGKLNTEGSSLYTIPGMKGIPYTDSQGYLTPEGWIYAAKNFGVSAKDLIDEYSHLFNPKALENYQMSEVQKNLIRNKL